MISTRIQTPSSISFCSKKHPIPKQTFKTDKGDIFIREATKEDVPNIVDFAFNTGKTGNPNIDNMYDKETQKEALNYVLDQGDGNGSILIAETNNQDLIATSGMAKLTNSNILPQIDKVGYIFNCFTDKGFRGKGVGKKLVSLLINSVKGEYTDVSLESYKGAVGFYKKLGFKESDTSTEPLRVFHKVTRAYLLNKTEVLMDKNIDPTNPWTNRIELKYKPNDYKFADAYIDMINEEATKANRTNIK